MRLHHYVNSRQRADKCDIPDANVEGFLRDTMGFEPASSWTDAGERCTIYMPSSSEDRSRTAVSIIVTEKDGFGSAILFENTIKQPWFRRPPSTAYRQELERIEHLANDFLTLYSIWGGRITSRRRIERASADPHLLREARIARPDFLEQAALSIGGQLFTIQLTGRAHKDESGDLSFEVSSGDSDMLFCLYPPGGDIYLQEVGLFGGLGGSSFNAEFKASLSRMTREERARHAPKLGEEESHGIACEMLANRPALMAIMPLHPKDPVLCEQFLQAAIHFALAVLV